MDKLRLFLLIAFSCTSLVSATLGDSFSNRVRMGPDNSVKSQRYEPTRPQYATQARIQSNRGNRYEPTRPSGRSASARYEPTRPGEFFESSYRQPESRRDLWSSAQNNYNQWESVDRGYDAFSSDYSRYQEMEGRYDDYRKARKWHQKVSKSGKAIFRPVKYAFKLSKKAVSKATLGWLPLF